MVPEIDPPLLTSTASYEQWKLDTRAWALITDLSREKQAIAVALHLPADHESKIKEKVFEQLELEELQKESGLSTLFDFLDKHLQKDGLTDILETFGDFENYKRKDGQSMHEYVCLFDFKYRKIEKLQINLPPEILAFRLLQGANISRQEQLIILTRIDFEKKATMYEEAKKMLKRFTGCKGVITWCSSRSEESAYKFYNGRFVNERCNQAFLGENCTQQARDEVYASVSSGAGDDRKTRCESVVNQGGIKKKINPTGRDAEVLKCLSCGSYRHLLAHCPDSWENMMKKVEGETPEKSFNQSKSGKKLKQQVGSHFEAVIAKLTQEVAKLKEDNKTLRQDLKVLQLGCERQMESRARGQEVKSVKEYTAVPGSTVQELNQVLNSIEKGNSILDSKIEELVEKIENSVSGLKSQNENLFNMIKNQGIENSLKTGKKIETSNFQKKRQGKELLSDNLNEQRNRNVKHWTMILSELENQITSLEVTEEAIEGNQSVWDCTRDNAEGVAGSYRMRSKAVIKREGRQKLCCRIRQLQEIRDSDQIIRCSRESTLSNSMKTIAVVFCL